MISTFFTSKESFCPKKIWKFEIMWAVSDLSTVDEKKQFISFNHFMDIFGGICSGNLVEHEQQWCVLSPRFGVAFCLPILF